MTATIESGVATSDLYVGRVAYETEEIAAALEALGAPILTEAGNLVVPIVRPGKLPEEASGDTFADRVVTALGRHGMDQVVAAEIGDPFLVSRKFGGSPFDVKTNLSSNDIPTLRTERERANGLFLRWRVETVGLHPAILVTQQPVAPEAAHGMVDVLHWYKGMAVLLGGPAVLGAAR